MRDQPRGAQPVRQPRLQRPQLDEAGRGLLREQPAGLGERRQRRVVDGVRRLARDDPHRALVELQPDRAGHLRVDRVHVGVEVAAQRLPPQPGVDEVAPTCWSSCRLELVLVDRADQLLELLVGGQDDRRGRHLVDVAHLQADDAVLDVVDDPDAVAAADLGGALEQLDEPEPLAVRAPPARRARSSTSRPRARRAPPRAASRAGRRRPPARASRSSIQLALRRAAPEVVVDRVRARPRCRP